MRFKDERRTETRSAFRMSIECFYEAKGCEEKSPWKTFTADISHRGMGLYSKCPAEEGQSIKVFVHHVSKEPIIAEVKWCKKYVDDLYKIGIQYLNPPVKFSP